MPTTRKKVIKTVYKDDSEAENSIGDFSDSGSEAEIPEAPSSTSDEEEEVSSASAEEFDEKSNKFPKAKVVRKPKFAKDFISKINRQLNAGDEPETVSLPLFNVKDLTEEDKLLPSVLNLSESDSSDDETPKTPTKKSAIVTTLPFRFSQDSDSENETKIEYKDVWSQNIKDDSEELAKKTFMELEQHKTQIEETKASLLNYQASVLSQGVESNVTDLLALGEEALPETKQVPDMVKKGRKGKKTKNDSDSEIEDWEEVNEAKTIPSQGLQLIVDFPDAACRKAKKIDVEMMMKRKINRVKKEYQVYMHKVHVLCWLGHGNYVSRVLNDQEVLAAALSLVPSKECYPSERVDMKYLEQITTWYKDKLILKQDKNEEKFRPKAPPLRGILIGQIKSRIVTTKKYTVFIFVSMLRALGLQCRIMFNFTTLPIKPPTSELCSLSTKEKKKGEEEHTNKKSKESKPQVQKSNGKKGNKGKICQVDGNDYSYSSDDDTDLSNIMQLDGNDDTVAKSRSTRTTRINKKSDTLGIDEDVSPPKRARKSPSRNLKSGKEVAVYSESEILETVKRKQATTKNITVENISNSENTVDQARTRRMLSRRQNKTDDNGKVDIMDVTQHKTESQTASAKKPKTPNRITTSRTSQSNKNNKSGDITNKTLKIVDKCKGEKMDIDKQEITIEKLNKRTSKDNTATTKLLRSNKCKQSEVKKLNPPPQIIVTQHESEINVSSKYFGNEKITSTRKLSLNRNRSQTANPSTSQKIELKPKARTKSEPGIDMETSKFFEEYTTAIKKRRNTKQRDSYEDEKRVSHRDLLAKNKPKSKNDVTGDLVNIIKKRVKEATEESKKGKVKRTVRAMESDEDSDHLPEVSYSRKYDSDEDFKPCKISPKPSNSKKIDRRVLSSSDSEELLKNKCDVWCEVFVEELEQWIAVDVIRAKVHCTNELYSHATHPVCYVVGWDNNNYLKDLTRRYVPHWNTVTRKLRAEPVWWDKAIKPWLGPNTARDKEEDEQLDRMQLDAPLPKSIAEYKNHPLYALKRHLLKFEAIYPPDAATLGFVRQEPVYARECVYVCRSRDIWLKEAKVVKLGEQPYKIVKARPKWDRLSNKLIKDKALELFGPWQTMDYEPPVAENGIVPRNAYGNVELFKACMLPKGTVHIKLPGLNRVAKKLNIDCAPAMTGFDFNGGWSHPVYDGFVVCKEFEEIVTEAWVKDQEDQERREREKIETRVYGNWRRLIRGLFIRERLQNKYGFEEPPLESDKKKKGPKLVVKKK